MYKVENIVKGGATILFAGGPVGYTRDATTLGQEKEDLRIDDIQQIVGVADIRRIKVGFVIKMNLYENTLENMKLAWGLNSSVQIDPGGGKSIDIDLSGDYPEGELIIYGKGPNNVLRTIKWYRAKLIESGEMAIDAHSALVMPVTFQILVHPDETYLGKITEEYTPSGTVKEYY